MKLQCSEFLITCTFQLHASTLILSGNFYYIALGPFSWIRSHILKDSFLTRVNRLKVQLKLKPESM